MAKAKKTDVTPKTQSVVTKVTETLGMLHHTSHGAMMNGLLFPWTLMSSCRTWAGALGSVSSSETQRCLGLVCWIGGMKAVVQASVFWARLREGLIRHWRVGAEQLLE